MITNTLIPCAVVLGLMVAGSACSNKKQGEDNDQTADVEQEEWTAMDNFHMVMAEAFHPYKDSANLGPAKEQAAALVKAAEKWSEAPLPEKFQEDDEIKFKINQLKIDATTFAETVKEGDDKAIGESLTKLHNLFHALQESWYEPREGHH
jgi:hypothetical protein